MKIEMFEVAKLHLDPEQPRETYHGIEGLTESMKSSGFKENEAITGWRHKDMENVPYDEGHAQVGDGHRRTMGAMKAGIEKIPAFIYDLSDMPATKDKTSLERAREFIWEIQLVANANREDLSTMNRARSFKRSLDDFGWSVGRVAKVHGVSPATVKADLELCNLAPELHKLVDAGSLPKEVARKLATAEIFNADTEKMETISHSTQMSIFNNWVKDKRTASQMTAAIQAYIDKNNQREIPGMDRAKNEAAENGGFGKTRKRWDRFAKAFGELQKNSASEVFAAKKRERQAVKLTFENMKKMAEAALKEFEAAEAKRELNAPKTAVAAG